MAQSELVKSFVDKLKAIMEYDTQQQQDQILDNIASLCTYLRNLEHSQKLKKQSPYEKRKFNQDFQYMQNQLAAVRKAKVPRKVFSFSSRKYIQQQVEKKEEVQQEIEYDQNRLIKDVKDQTIDLTKPYKEITPEDLANSDINIQNVTNCTILLPNVQIVFISNIQNCHIVTEKISSAFHCEGATNCQLEISAHQFRIHQSFNCTFTIEAGSAPIIEKCNMLKFKARKTTYFGEENAEKWKEIRNFSFLKNQKDPNYDIIED